MTWIFGSFLVTPCALASCHVVISKQGDDIGVRAVRSNRCVTGRRPRYKHVVRFRQSAENRESSEGHAADQRVMLSLTMRLARTCKRWLPPGTRKKTWDKNKYSLWVYGSLHLYLKLTTNSGLLSRLKWEIYFDKEKCFVSSLSLIMFLVVHKDTAENTTVVDQTEV